MSPTVLLVFHPSKHSIKNQVLHFTVYCPSFGGRFGILGFQPSNLTTKYDADLRESNHHHHINNKERRKRRKTPLTLLLLPFSLC
ncbi:hypothetical protein RIF29_25321 [Crotalaria pallida]|uniref:Uncharacterized protein n=1 Tax=Crotalaria pallida TaxID=3830 RepID=A0AAN9EM61_CROPI